jgi:hypothetical protein
MLVFNTDFEIGMICQNLGFHTSLRLTWSPLHILVQYMKRTYKHYITYKHGLINVTYKHNDRDISYVCVYVCMCVCMYVCMYVCMNVWMYTSYESCKCIMRQLVQVSLALQQPWATVTRPCPILLHASWWRAAGMQVQLVLQGRSRLLL